jgi:hypothetical protein
VPFKANAAGRHHIARQRHRVTNWSEYDAALRQRGSLTVWFTEEAIAAWRAEPRTTRGGQLHYSALAITTGLTLRADSASAGQHRTCASVGGQHWIEAVRCRRVAGREAWHLGRTRIFLAFPARSQLSLDSIRCLDRRDTFTRHPRDDDRSPRCVYHTYAPSSLPITTATERGLAWQLAEVRWPGATGR